MTDHDPERETARLVSKWESDAMKRAEQALADGNPHAALEHLAEAQAYLNVLKILPRPTD